MICRPLSVLFILGILLLGCLPPTAADVGPTSSSDDVARLERPTWGKVIGWVLDAGSRRPIPGARVRVEVDGSFPDSGKTTDETDRRGRFEARAPLGKISSRFDWGRVLTMHPIGLLLSPRSVTKQTRIVDVTQFNVRVTAEGYRPFLGRVRATLLDAARFSVTLDDVWLSPEGGTGISFTPENLRLESIDSFTAEPTVAAPGGKVRLTLVAHLPLDRGYRYQAYAESSAIRLVEDGLELKRDKSSRSEDDPTRVQFVRDLTMPRTSVDRFTELSVYLERNGTTQLRRRTLRILLQVPRTEAERAAAERVDAGFKAELLNQREKALHEYQAARGLAPEYAVAHLRTGDLALTLQRPEIAAQAYTVLVEQDPTDYMVARPRAARARFEAGQAAEAEKLLAGCETQIGKQKLPADVALMRARLAAASANFAEADRWLSRVVADGGSVPDWLAAEIGLSRGRHAVRENPMSADAHLALARVLVSTGQAEEALLASRRAAELDPSQPFAFIEWADALLALDRPGVALPLLEAVLAAVPDSAEANLLAAEAHRRLRAYDRALPLYERAVASRKFDLPARHGLAIMLFAADRLPEARRALLDVVTLAHEKGELEDEGLPIPGGGIYFGPKRRLVVGFSIPQAVADAELLDALQDLERHPENALLWQNVGSALADLQLPDLAEKALTRSLAADGTNLETRYLLAVVRGRLGRVDEARRELQSVLQAHPLHPNARLELARLLADAGELDLAQAELAVHRRNYPNQRANRLLAPPY